MENESTFGEKFQHALRTVQSAVRRIKESLSPYHYRRTQLPEGRIHPDDLGLTIFEDIDRRYPEPKPAYPVVQRTPVVEEDFFAEYKDRK